MKTKREKPKKSLSRRLVLAVDGVINHLLLIFAALIFLFGFYALLGFQPSLLLSFVK
ncbi:sortase [Streptococcus pneumoniae]|nr:sortase [Streptococcus pneumoniae]VNL56722.1 sortase [Streptococcus pneumoniae]